MHTYIHAYVHKYIYSFIHTCTQTHIHPSQHSHVLIHIHNARYFYERKKHPRNFVVSLNALTRNLFMQNKVKLEWKISTVEDYLVATRCFRCSWFNHLQDCLVEEACFLCAVRLKMKECTAESYEYKCINCATYNSHNQIASICENHSTLYRNCPSLQALLERYRQNIDYLNGVCCKLDATRNTGKHRK